MRVLAISAHPDDETIGAGGTLARHVAEGDEVFWCVVTQGYNPPWPEHVLEEAQRQVNAVQQVMGFREVFRCGFPTVKLNTVPHMELTSAIQTVVDKVLPEVVYAPPLYDLNPDHRLVCEAALVATRPLPGCTVERLLSYEIGPTVRYAPTPFQPNVYVDITAYLGKKLEAMACYHTELREYPHPRSLRGLEQIARERGLSVCVEAAECFELLREVV